MSNENTVADHWGRDDVYSLIVSILEKMSKPLDSLTMDDRVTLEHGDGHQLPYEERLFDGAYAQHVTMNGFRRKGRGVAPTATIQPS